ncbi:hypothetical protein MHU86_4712 [Fragilaria crotonensis]|nr:hypothetical protein MHU86_4712 [Fragilaria crotonensis]
MEPEQVGDIDFNAMFPGVENHAIRYVFHVCGLTDIAAQTRLIDFEGIDEVEDLANYTDREIDQMADRNAKRNPANQRVQFGLKRTKYLKAVCHWVRKNVREGAPCDVRELTPALIAELIQDMIARASQKDSDSKLYYPEAFSATDYKNWIKKVENYLDSRIGKSGVPLSYVIRPANVDPAEAPDEYTRAMWATSFETQQFREDNREVYHLFKDLVTKTEGATWFEKVKDGDGRAAHLLLREHYVGEAHDMRRAAAANAKLESLFWKSEASFSFEKYLTRLNEAFKELEDAGQALWEAQKVTHLLKGIQNDDIQVQTTIGIVRNSFLSDFDGACLTLSRTISSRFASVEANRQKRRIGAVESRAGNRSGRGRARGRGGRGGRGGGRDGGRMRVIMNGVDVTDISRNFTSDEWEKLRACGGHTYVTQRREYLSGRYGGRNDNRSGGRGGRGARGSQGRNDSNQSTNAASASTRNVSATNTTEIVEFDTSTSTIASQASTSTRGGQSGGRFGPRRSD